MSIKDNVNEISENNVTIAENLEKVYNAGMRAGLAQDPDYAEGYDDGYEQGLTDSSGVVWEDLLSGKVPVGKAKEADHADKATNAENAENAKNANHAKSADNATNANRATEANHAAEADHSVEADHATEADHSVEADHATNADKANTAVSADHATTATVANSTNSFNGVLPIENGGTGADNAEQARINLGIPTYQKPWDVNGAVGSIVLHPHSTGDEWEELEDNQPGYRHRKFSHRLPMINSGKVYLHFDPYAEYDNAPDNSLRDDEFIAIRIYSGDVVIYENRQPLTKSGMRAINNINEMKLINVTKNNDIRLEAEERRYFNDNTYKPYGFHRFEDIYLSANIDTPYKYFSLVDREDTDMEEIINTLLGV